MDVVVKTYRGVVDSVIIDGKEVCFDVSDYDDGNRKEQEQFEVEQLVTEEEREGK